MLKDAEDLTPQDSQALPSRSGREKAVDTEMSTIEAARGDETNLPAWAAAIKPYVLLGKIGEGGFSEIWEAVQVELQRIVAIKRLKTKKKDSGKSRAVSERRLRMFQQEAIVSAHLEHPNILPVYTLEQDAQGVPFLVMKRIKGEPWSMVIERELLLLAPDEFLRKHLAILASVGRAVAYAHSKGIIHRDLKPSQVMLGSYGEVLLMDWGLAMAYPRRCGDAEAPEWLRDPTALVNNPINPAGTPSYMAPEQTLSTTSRLGPWTDVYLLGGILYKLLSGMPPHLAESGSETFKLAQDGLVIPVEEVAKDRPVPPQLAKLAMTALEYDPEKRVPNVESFLDALEEYLTGADRKRESTRLTVQVQERLSAGATSYDTLAECINSLERALVLWSDNVDAQKLHVEVLQRYVERALANRDLRLARLQAERLPPSAIREMLLKQIQELEEEQRRRDAELALAHARIRTERDRAEQLVEFLVGDLFVELRRIGRLPILSAVCEKAIAYFDGLDMEAEAEEAIITRLRALFNIADVHLARGANDLAQAVCKRALDLSQSQLAKAPSSREYRLFAAKAWLRLGKIAYHRGDYTSAKNAFQLAQENVFMLGREGYSPELEALLAEIYHNFGVAHWRVGELEQALELHIEAETIMARLTRQHTTRQDYAALRAAILATLSNVYRDIGLFDFAADVLQECVRLRQRLVTLDQGDVTRRSDLTWARNNLALLHLIQGKQMLARELFLQSVEDSRELIKLDSENLQYIRDLGFALSLAGEVEYIRNALPDAEKLLREANVVAQEIARRDSQSLHAQCGVARTHVQLGEVLFARGEKEGWHFHLSQGKKLAAEILAQSPGNPTAIKTWVRAQLLLILTSRVSSEERETLLAQVEDSLKKLKTSADELDRLDNEAALALARGDKTGAAAVIEKLAARHWLAPALRVLAGRLGIEIVTPSSES
jgi:serine/threonine protein kinase/tetratricopeptide (TPR) repeat protein